MHVGATVDGTGHQVCAVVRESALGCFTVRKIQLRARIYSEDCELGWGRGSGKAESRKRESRGPEENSR